MIDSVLFSKIFVASEWISVLALPKKLNVFILNREREVCKRTVDSCVTRTRF
jgi:hypothetical protein